MSETAATEAIRTLFPIDEEESKRAWADLIAAVRAVEIAPEDAGEPEAIALSYLVAIAGALKPYEEVQWARVCADERARCARLIEAEAAKRGKTTAVWDGNERAALEWAAATVRAQAATEVTP